MGTPQPDVESHSGPTSDVEMTQPKVEEEVGDVGHDPNLVDWDGPGDPQNPLNWSRNKKIGSAAVVSLITILTYDLDPKMDILNQQIRLTLAEIISPLGSSMFAPGVSQVMDEFNSTNLELGSFVVSVYLLGYAFGPLVLAPLSETYGRRIIYNVNNLLFVVFNVACAVAPNMGALIVFRLLAGTAGSAPLTIGAGSLADMIHQKNRGLAMGVWVLGPVLGPAIGPIIGSYLTQAKGWRWTFWLLAIAGGAMTIFAFIFMPESAAFTLLENKTKQLRKETGNPQLKSILDTGRSTRQLFIYSISRPTKMLFLSPIVFLLSLYIAIIYGYLYLLFTTMTDVFENEYHFSQGSVGLAYLGIGVGSILGMIFQSMVSDPLFKYMCSKHSNISKPEYRLIPLFLGAFTIPLSLFWYGWTAEKQDHWILPIIGTGFLGFGMLSAFTTVSTYLVDAYTAYAASAMAANTVFRSLGGALLPMAGKKMYGALGLGWGNSLLAFIALAMCPLPFLFYRYGEMIRISRVFRVEF